MVINRIVYTLTRLDRMDISKIMPLVDSWLVKGVNFLIARLFVAHCLESVKQ